MGMSISKTLNKHSAARCGYTGTKNFETRERENFMESFFLGETTKYLYMLSKKNSSLMDYFVINTEVKDSYLLLIDNTNLY